MSITNLKFRLQKKADYNHYTVQLIAAIPHTVNPAKNVRSKLKRLDQKYIRAGRYLYKPHRETVLEPVGLAKIKMLAAILDFRHDGKV